MVTPTSTPSLLSPPQWVLQWSEIVAGLGTIILTVGLIVLYKKQKDQLAAQHEAVLQVTDFDWTEDKATVEVSNFGNGVAKRLRLTTLLQVDTGDHQRFAIRSNVMERTDKSGNRPNAIQPEEEDVPFEGKSHVGKPAPVNFGGDWISQDFSDFVREMKDRGATEVKYLHLIEGEQLSKKKVSESIYLTTRSVNPQQFDRHHSLENPPGVTQHGYDHTFDHYFINSYWKWVKDRWNFTRLRVVNSLLPRVSLRVRPIDVSGKKRVKRVLLRRDFDYQKNRLKGVMSSVYFRIWSLIASITVKLMALLAWPLIIVRNRRGGREGD